MKSCGLLPPLTQPWHCELMTESLLSFCFIIFPYLCLNYLHCTRGLKGKRGVLQKKKKKRIKTNATLSDKISGSRLPQNASLSCAKRRNISAPPQTHCANDGGGGWGGAGLCKLWNVALKRPFSFILRCKSCQPQGKFR